MHATERVDQIRASVREERAAIASLVGTLTDAHLKQMLQRAMFSLDDVESFFLGSLLREPRTPAAESTWLDHAEIALDIGRRQRAAVQQIVEKYGPNAQAIGG